MTVTDRSRVREIRADAGHTVRVVRADGTEQSVDLAPMIMQYKIFQPLRRDRALFESVRLEDDGRTIVWTDEIDMAAETVQRLAAEQHMSDTEFRHFLARHGLSWTAGAAVLGISRRQVAYYAQGTKPIPRTIALACRGYDALAAA